MAKRFTDTDKYKKRFIRSLKGPYKLLWDYLYHDCDHAGIWIVDFEIAQIYLGPDMDVEEHEALLLFNEGKDRVIPFCDDKKWFIPGFVEFQYGDLNPENRAHKSVITLLQKYDLLDKFNKGLNKDLKTPSKGCKDKDKDKYKDKVKDIVKFFNETCGTKYRDSTKSINESISARLGEGYTVDDFKTVIRTKYNDWKDDQKMREYITPDTLFRPSNFPKYLNKVKPSGGGDITADIDPTEIARGYK